MQLKPFNSFSIAFMMSGALLLVFFCSFLEFPFLSTSIKPINDPTKFTPDPFTNLIGAFRKWDAQVGCSRFREKHKLQMLQNKSSSLQQIRGESECGEAKSEHVSVLVKGWTWIPDNLDSLYSCSCGLSCLWTKSPVLADKPDALLFETTTPPLQRHSGDPLRVYMDLEAGRKRSGVEDIFISYHAKDDVQSTYAGALFHNGRNYHVSPYKNNDTLVYWSSSRCLSQRNTLAHKLLSLLPHHSFGKCLNNVGGLNMALSFYPDCAGDTVTQKWWDHLHCAMSHYKFVLAIENTMTESYVTEKLFYALDSGSVPIYFGAPNVWDFVPPHSIIDGTKFKSLEELASYVKSLANDPVAYAEYHAWRRCGVMANYVKTRALSLDTLPCRLCEAVSRKGGRNGRTK
ncbi:alpha-(1-4)-fucosyltransferase-like [Pyrus ussuriensis x Pyrus communis]|uniref:Fucosyltransferase n=1 Tax=Pyrus ussuriensis x Pyrus communis TaxID=2448454 RepID=A0A5N5FL61_9ROSA|nr:alpha-(1-4)-fucosyltransferase-like [Pyrus ussuriensis x Pyrus communis]